MGFTLDGPHDNWVDVFVGWILSAYFLGAYGDDGKGMNGSMKAITAAAKSWAVGIPVRLHLLAIQLMESRLVSLSWKFICIFYSLNEGIV